MENNRKHGTVCRACSAVDTMSIIATVSYPAEIRVDEFGYADVPSAVVDGVALLDQTIQAAVFCSACGASDGEAGYRALHGNLNAIKLFPTASNVINDHSIKMWARALMASPGEPREVKDDWTQLWAYYKPDMNDTIRPQVHRPDSIPAVLRYFSLDILMKLGDGQGYLDLLNRGLKPEALRIPDAVVMPFVFAPGGTGSDCAVYAGFPAREFWKTGYIPHDVLNMYTDPFYVLRTGTKVGLALATTLFPFVHYFSYRR